MEFALLVMPLVVIVFGIFSFGVMLSFRQTVSQAATEGARAAAVELEAGNREPEAIAAVNDAMQALDMQCGAGALDCDYTIGACGSHECVTVTVSYPYQDNPLVPSVPLVGELLPDMIEYSATVRVS